MVTKERILETSTKLFLARGCKSLTMDDISAANGISKRTLYEMFTDKSALLEACIKVMFEKRKAFFEEVCRTTDNVLEFLLKIHDFESESIGNTSGLFFEEIQKFFPDVYERTFLGMRQEHEKHTKSMLLKGREQGVFIDNLGDIEMEAKILAFFVKNPSAGASDLDRNTYSRKEIFFNTFVIYLRGLSTPKGMKIIDDYFLRSNNLNNN